MATLSAQLAPVVAWRGNGCLNFNWTCVWPINIVAYKRNVDLGRIRPGRWHNQSLRTIRTYSPIFYLAPRSKTLQDENLLNVCIWWWRKCATIVAILTCAHIHLRPKKSFAGQWDMVIWELFSLLPGVPGRSRFKLDIHTRRSASPSSRWMQRWNYFSKTPPIQWEVYWQQKFNILSPHLWYTWCVALEWQYNVAFSSHTCLSVL